MQFVGGCFLVSCSEGGEIKRTVHPHGFTIIMTHVSNNAKQQHQVNLNYNSPDHFHFRKATVLWQLPITAAQTTASRPPAAYKAKAWRHCEAFAQAEIAKDQPYADATVK